MNVTEQRKQYLEKLRNPRDMRTSNSPKFNELLRRIEKGDKSVLKDPAITERSGWGDGKDTLLHDAAYRFVEVLQHPEVSKVRDLLNMETPLHIAAMRYVQALKHKDVARVKDIHGNTPLHSAAIRFPEEVLKHPMAAKVKNKDGQTPEDLADQQLQAKTDMKQYKKLPRRAPKVFRSSKANLTLEDNTMKHPVIAAAKRIVLAAGNLEKRNRRDMDGFVNAGGEQMIKMVNDLLGKRYNTKLLHPDRPDNRATFLTEDERNSVISMFKKKGMKVEKDKKGWVDITKDGFGLQLLPVEDGKSEICIYGF